jgi:hypothetical protein
MASRFHRQGILPFIPNPLSYVEVTDSEVRWQDGLNERWRLPLEAVRASHDPKGLLWGHLFGSGDVVVTDVTDHRVPDVLRGRALRAKIAQQREILERRKTSPDAAISGSAAAPRPSFQVVFREHAGAFEPSTAQDEAAWFDSSFAQSNRAVGRLRIFGPSNGRYESRHPVLAADGSVVGYLDRGVATIGYTFNCVFAAECFWISHQHFGAVLGGGGSSLSVVQEQGTFPFSGGTVRYKVTKSFEFGGQWPDTSKAFKLLDDGKRLLYLTSYGACLFATSERTIISRLDWPELAYYWSGFSLSPTAKLLALGCSVPEPDDPLGGERPHRNFLRVYDIESGTLVGEQILPAESSTRWIVAFSRDGHQLRATSGATEKTYALEAIRSPLAG